MMMLFVFQTVVNPARFDVVTAAAGAAPAAASAAAAAAAGRVIEWVEHRDHHFIESTGQLGQKIRTDHEGRSELHRQGRVSTKHEKHECHNLQRYDDHMSRRMFVSPSVWCLNALWWWVVGFGFWFLVFSQDLTATHSLLSVVVCRVQRQGVSQSLDHA